MREKKEAVEVGARGNVGLVDLEWAVREVEERWDEGPPKKLMMMIGVTWEGIDSALVMACA